MWYSVLLPSLVGDLMPKIGEYWYLNIPLKNVDLDRIELHSIIAECVSVTENGPVFYGNAPTHYRSVYYGPGFYYCERVNKWEPNWFWRLLGYK